MNIPTPQELCQRREVSSALSNESTSTFGTIVDTILKTLEFYQKGTFEIVWLFDFTDDNEISKAISSFETKGWTVLKQSSTVPDWIILFANNDETVENCDITGEDF